MAETSFRISFILFILIDSREGKWMLWYIGKRLLQSIVTLFIIVTIVFALLRLMPEEGYLGAAAEKCHRNNKKFT